MIIQCPECGGNVSDKATSCPHCGCPMQEQTVQQVNEEYLCCPKCHSRNIQAEKKGFSTGKALAGGLAFGLYGILAGNIGANDEVLICLKCGNKFKAGAAFIENSTDKKLSEEELETKIAELLAEKKSNEALELYSKEKGNGSPVERMQFFNMVIKKYDIHR